MKIIVLLLCVTCIGLPFYAELQAQCPPPNYPWPANSSCAAAPILCANLNGYCNTLPNDTGNQPFPGCDPIHSLNNDEWIAFIAGSTSITIEVIPQNCYLQDHGLQAGIYDGCNGPIMDVQCDCAGSGDAFLMQSDNYIIGNIYWMVLDGCAGDICDYTINVITGSTIGMPPDPPGSISGPITICENDISNYSISTSSGASQYTWTLAPTIGTLDSDGSENVEITWDNGYGTAELCVTVENECLSNNNNSCITILVYPEGEETLNETICEGSCFTVGSTSYCSAGTYNHHLLTEMGCDSSVILNLSILDVTATIDGDNMLNCVASSLILDGSSSSPAGVTYNWTTSDGIISGSFTSPTITVEDVGTYFLEVFYTQNGTTCSDMTSITVTEDVTPPIINILDPGDLDCNSTTTIINASGSIPLNLLQFNWTGPSIVNGNGTPIITVDAPGTYSVIVNGQNSCTAEASVTVEENIAYPNIEIQPPQQIDCNTTTIVIDASGSDSGSNLTINWTGGNIISGANTLTPTVDEGGIYTLTITNSENGCSSTQNVQVQENTTLPTATIQNTGQLDCITNILILNATGSGNAISSYNWSTSNGNIVSGQNSLMPTIDAPGTYTIQVTDNDNGCTNTASLTVIEDTTSPTLNITPPDLLNCNNQSININGNASGGSNFAFNWSTTDGNIVSGGNTLNPTVNQPGLYQLIVTNNGNGCTTEESVTILEDVTQPSISILPADEINCFTPIITLDGSGSSSGTNFSYNWSGSGIVNGWTSQNPTVNAGGFYTLNILNSENGCTASEMIFVNESTTPPPAMISAPIHLDCLMKEVPLYGMGSGNPTSSFQWSGPGIVSGENTLTPTVNAPGTYSIFVNDWLNGCSNWASVLIIQDTMPPIASAGNDQLIDCDSGNQLTLDGTNSSNGFNYEINWTTPDGNIVFGESSLNPTVDQDGVYNLLIINNNNGCTAEDEVIVQQALDLPEVSILPPNQISCTEEIILIDGTNSDNGSDFIFEWQTLDGNFENGQNSLSPTVNAPGIYTLTITNLLSNCSASQSITVEVNTTFPELNFLDVDILNCENDAILLEGETTSNLNNVDIFWTTQNGNITGSQDKLLTEVNEPGDYILSITDLENDCITSDTISVESNHAVPIADAGVDEILNCNSENIELNGSLSNIGNEYNYLWQDENGQILATNTLNPLVELPGEYILVVTDINSLCTAMDTVNIAQDTTLPKIEIALADTLSCDVQSIFLDATNSDSGSEFQIIWSTYNGNIISGETTLTPNINSPGNYQLTIVDTSNNCESTTQIVVSQDVTVPNVHILVSDTINCWKPSVFIETQNLGQASDFFYHWQTTDGNILSNPNNAFIEVNRPGEYQLQVLNEQNGCSTEKTVFIFQDTLQPIANAGIDLTILCTEPSVLVDGSQSSTGDEFEYYWMNEQGDTISSEINPSIATDGQYFLSVLNQSNGCATQDTVLIFQDVNVPKIEIAPLNFLTCFMQSIVIDASNSDSGDSLLISWETVDGNILSFENELMPEVNQAGIYTLTLVNEKNGCSNVEHILINEDFAPPLLKITQPDTLTCIVESLMLDASASGEESDFQVNWQTSNGNILTGVTSLLPTINQPGNYLLTLTNNSNGCSDSLEVEVIQNLEQPSVDAGLGGVLTCDNPTLELTGEIPSNIPVSYFWSTQNGAIQSGVNTLNPMIEVYGIYTLTVTNLINGCTNLDEVLIEENIDLPNIIVQNPNLLTCTDSIINIDATGSDFGTDFLLEWNTNDGNILSGNQTLTPLVNASGNYQLTILNVQNGCSGEATILIEENMAPPIIGLEEPALLTCSVEEIQLVCKDMSTNELSYFWTTTNGNILSGQNTESIDVDAAGTYAVIVTDLDNGCMTESEVTVNQDIALPVADAGANQFINCSQTETTLYGGLSTGGNNMTYYWSTLDGNILEGENTLYPNINSGGNYEILVTNIENGCTATDQVFVYENFEIPQIEIVAEGLLTCEIQEITLNAESSSNGASFSYNWTTQEGIIQSGGNSLIPIVSAVGEYNLEIINNYNGCTNTASIKVEADRELPIVVATTPDGINCETKEAFLLSNVEASSENLKYNWASSDGVILAGQYTEMPLVQGVGNYTVNVTNLENGCTAETDVSIFENLPVADLDSMEPFCVDGLGQINIVSVTEGTPPYKFSFDGGNNFSTETQINDVSSGDYLVVIKDDNDCEYAETVQISEGIDPILDMESEVTLQLGESYQIEAFINFPEAEIESIIWSPSNGLSCTDCLLPQISPYQNTIYGVVIRTNEGCEVSGSITINIPKEANIYVPNVFSPNNDGINDVFMIYGNEQQIAKIHSFSGFDRWGEPVFEFSDFLPNDPQFGWDGTYRNTPLSQGVFVWFAEIEIVDGRREILKGDVLLVL